MKVQEMLHGDGTHWGWAVDCPACGYSHLFDGRWTFNGDRDRPTFYGSMLARTQDTVCHSFVTDGRIQFLDDCTHSLKGQTVDLPEWEE